MPVQLLSAQPKRWQDTTRTASDNCPGRTRPQQCSLLRTMITVHHHPSSSNFWNRRPNGNQLLGNRKQLLIHIFSATTIPQPTTCHNPTLCQAPVPHRVRSHVPRRINFGIILPERTSGLCEEDYALAISTMGEIFTGEGRKGNFPASPYLFLLPTPKVSVVLVIFLRPEQSKSFPH